MPPPPGFPPFLFPENDGGMDADDICARFGGLASLTFLQISGESSDISNTTDVPEVGVSRPPLLDSSSDVIPAAGYAHLPLPSVDNGVRPELVWMPALPQPTVDPGGSVPRRKVGGVYPLTGAWLCLQEHHLPCFGLC